MLHCVIAQCSYSLLKILARAVTEAGAEVEAMCLNGYEALSLTKKHVPDVLIVNGVMPGIDAAEVFRRVEHMRLSKRPAMIPTLPEGVDAGFSNARVCIRQPVTADGVRTALDQAFPMPINAKVMRRAHALMRQMGLPECEGRAFLAHAVALTLNDMRRVRRLTNGVYPMVAEVYQTTPRRVGDAIHRVIEKAWTKGDIERQYAFFGNTIDDERGMPTSGEFIALCADILRLEGAEGS